MPSPRGRLDELYIPKRRGRGGRRTRRQTNITSDRLEINSEKIFAEVYIHVNYQNFSDLVSELILTLSSLYKGCRFFLTFHQSTVFSGTPSWLLASFRWTASNDSSSTSALFSFRQDNSSSQRWGSWAAPVYIQWPAGRQGDINIAAFCSILGS